MNESDKFCSISEELLRMIVIGLGDVKVLDEQRPVDRVTDMDNILQETRLRAFLSYLKALRLTSRRFADSYFIQSILFKRIQLVPGPDELGALTQIKIGPLAGFVKTVAFVAPPYSWTLTFEDFRKSTLAQAIQRYGVHNNILYTYARVKMVPRLQGRGRHQPFHRNPDQEMSTRYEEYCAHALAAKSLLLGEELRAAWISALEALPYVEEVVIRSPRLVYQDRFYKAAAGPVGDALFTAGVAVLSAAGLKIRRLRIVGLMTGRLDWETLPGWKELDLRQLQIFVFRPRVWRHNSGTSGVDGSRTSGDNPTEDEKSYPQDEWSSGHGDSSEDDDWSNDDWREAEAMAYHWNTRSQSVAAVLIKSAHSIEEFKYSYLDSMDWPTNRVIPMPRLRYLSLRGYQIRPPNLAAWMARMPSLNHFRLSYSDWSNSGAAYLHHSTAWHCVLHAIRKHPKPLGMRVHLFNVDVYGHDFFDWNDTEDLEQYVRDGDVAGPHVNLDRALALYLSGKIEYNKYLKVLEGFDE